MQLTAATVLQDVVGTSAIDPSGTAGVTGIHPDGEEQVAQICRIAKDQQWRVVPRGRLLVHQRQSPTIALYTDKLTGISDYSPKDMIVSVRSGTPFEALQDILRKNGQMLPLDPVCDSNATIGGIVARGAYGPSRVRYGTLRDMVTGMRIVRADGNVISIGSKVVKNVAGYDLPKLFIGSHGSLGIITECTFKLQPIPRHQEIMALTGTAREVARAYQDIMSHAMAVSTLELVSAVQAPDPSEAVKHGEWTLLVGSGESVGAANVLREQVQIISGPTHLESLNNRDVTDFWDRYRRTLMDATTIIRVQAPPDRMVNLAATIRQLLTNQGLSAHWSFTLSDGVGKIYGHDPETKTVESLLYTVIDQCQRAGASISIEDLPAGFEWNRRMMQSPRVGAGEARLMQRIKDTYDPYGIFNPSVYARGM